MYYEINVSLNGKHFFATDERSIRTKAKLYDVLEVFMQKFPESEGYNVSVTYWEKLGKYIDIETIMKQNRNFEI